MTKATKRRRGHGEGSVFQRKADGRWCAQLDVGAGKKWRRYFGTRKEAADALHHALGEHRQGALQVGKRSTVAEYLAFWMTTKQLRPRIQRNYQREIDSRIVPAIGRRKLDELAPTIVQRFYSDLIQAGASLAARRYVHTVLHSALEQAVRWRLTSTNPAHYVEKPKADFAQPFIWSEEQAKAFLEATQTAADYPLWETLATTGVRLGEALALRWADVHWDRNALRIGQNVQHVKGLGDVYGPPKTKAGYREVVVPEFLLETLKAQRARAVAARLRWGPLWKDHDLVFPATRMVKSAGGAQDGSAVSHRFAAAAKGLELPHMKLHGLRHLYATLLLVKNVHPKIVQAQLGHANVGVTLNSYSHVIPQMGAEAARNIGEAYGLLHSSVSGG